TLIVSDLHIGADPVAPIYAGEDALPRLIEEQSGPLRLVLNGDTFDFLLDDGPLQLDRERAVSRLRDCATSRDGAPLLQSLVNVLADGGEVFVRPGNHDLELALPAVQDQLRTLVTEGRGPTARLYFAKDDEPSLFEVGPHRVLVTH